MAVEMKQKRAQWKKEREEETDQEVKKGNTLDLDKELENRGKEAEDSQIPQLESDDLLMPEISVGEDLCPKRKLPCPEGRERSQEGINPCSGERRGSRWTLWGAIGRPRAY